MNLSESKCADNLWEGRVGKQFMKHFAGKVSFVCMCCEAGKGLFDKEYASPSTYTTPVTCLRNKDGGKRKEKQNKIKVKPLFLKCGFIDFLGVNK